MLPSHSVSYAGYSGRGNKDSLGGFHDVISSINFAAIEELALCMRLESKLDINIQKSQGWNAKISKQPFVIGPYIHYEVTFRDGQKWFIRIPRNGHRLSETDEGISDNEWCAMIYVRGKTEQAFSTIAHVIPEVHGWEVSMHKVRYTWPVGCAFGFISRPEGSRVCDLWFDSRWSTQKKRLTILHGIAQAVAPLYERRAQRIGVFKIGADSAIESIGPALRNSIVSFGPETGKRGYGPHKSLYTQLDAMLRDRETTRHQTLEFECENRFLRFLIESIPSFMKDAPLAITYPNFNWETIFINESTCEITGLLGWDGVRIESAARGCARYPNWIMADWNHSIDASIQNRSQTTIRDSTEQLSAYRQYYVSCWEEIARRLEFTDYDPRWTRYSHILEAIVSCFDDDDRVQVPQVFDQLLNYSYAGNGEHGCFPDFYTRRYLPEYCAKKPVLLKGMEYRIEKQLRNLWRAGWE